MSDLKPIDFEIIKGLNRATASVFPNGAWLAAPSCQAGSTEFTFYQIDGSALTSSQFMTLVLSFGALGYSADVAGGAAKIQERLESCPSVRFDGLLKESGIVKASLFLREASKETFLQRISQLKEGIEEVAGVKPKRSWLDRFAKQGSVPSLGG